MLIVLAKAIVPEGALASAKEAIATMVAASRAEEGCIEYTFTTDVLDPTRLHIVEKWRDQAALVAHFATPHMAAFQAAIGGSGVEVTEVLKYQADEGGPLF